MNVERDIGRVEQHIREIEERVAEALAAVARQESPKERAFLTFLGEALALSREHLAILKSK
ncbi:hypothetical protein EN817_29465 [Mesorhizobium sp. M3A.F.Ca.ET.174.01.1.1]|uniref:hypothetical protein n=1 Tax=unclassified Mesorhizobium TaxID=325217 RepID=UPI0010941592|nr:MULTISPECIES: hypothetical protein [unclassified Mesorhizobium]TGS71487.1 hypothetical protein EN844_00255 [Mesorhizobium sp. M3A.F.Ca.ET.201.01.1.1]TGS82100.1 hypothetical protein EN818_29240 [Mesorhizobium sp. M3A.F.Ca.ET.175.01.1.1]TGT21962.1 hypothetical protein EN817_29465 [Mesorhizobium sp. M3A.F.Ca.ET.174.01.1.1]